MLYIKGFKPLCAEKSAIKSHRVEGGDRVVVTVVLIQLDPIGNRTLWFSSSRRRIVFDKATVLESIIIITSFITTATDRSALTEMDETSLIEVEPSTID